MPCASASRHEPAAPASMNSVKWPRITGGYGAGEKVVVFAGVIFLKRRMPIRCSSDEGMVLGSCSKALAGAMRRRLRVGALLR